jgi:hypothetical protein
MRLNNLLAQRKTAIIKNWFTLAVETYPPDTASFLKKQKDPFANPVGRTISLGLEALFNELLKVKEIDYEITTSFLDPIIRIRAIQNFSPAQAISFIFLLKKAIRKNIKKEVSEEQLFRELLMFESKIDRMAMIAFNLYMECKEKIYDLKANEMRNTTYKAFKRAGLVREMPVEEPDATPNVNT